jgi:hypothetical protein
VAGMGFPMFCTGSHSAIPARRLEGRRDRETRSGQDAVFATWEALASLALQCLTLRAQQLPKLIGYAAAASVRAGAGLSAVTGRYARKRAGRTERCAAPDVHAYQRQGSGIVKVLRWKLRWKSGSETQWTSAHAEDYRCAE